MTPSGIETATFRFVAQHLNHCATAVLCYYQYCNYNSRVSLEFFIDIKSLRSHYGPGVDSASNRNEYQEYFLQGKGARCVRLTTYHLNVPAVVKFGRHLQGLLYFYFYCNYKIILFFCFLWGQVLEILF